MLELNAAPIGKEATDFKVALLSIAALAPWFVDMTLVDRSADSTAWGAIAVSFGLQAVRKLNRTNVNKTVNPLEVEAEETWLLEVEDRNILASCF